MDKLTAKADEGRMISESESALDRLLREGARRLLQAALDNEVTEYLAKMGHRQTEDGRRGVVRNGRLPERELVTASALWRSVNRACGIGSRKSGLPAGSCRRS